MPIIKLKNFDGPFDLLLHLIKKNEMRIHFYPTLFESRTFRFGTAEHSRKLAA